MNHTATIFTLAFSLFLLMDSIGNVPLFLSILKDYDPKRTRRIILREMCIALVVIIVFNFIGDALLNLLGVSQYTTMIAGGIILFLISVKMIFPVVNNHQGEYPQKKEPFIVPLAIPLVAGPAVLAAVMLYSHDYSFGIVIPAILIAWVVSCIVLFSSSLLKNFLGPRGLSALERLMGLVLTLIAVQMFLEGLSLYKVSE
jgi:multiple antibiotic resistance protein